MIKVINGVKYYPVSERIRFGLESMRDHAYYKVECEWKELTQEQIDHYYNLIDECEKLLGSITRDGFMAGKNYGRAKELTIAREYIRYNKCLEAGMSEREASLCFSD